jgi:hypothetical protein
MRLQGARQCVQRAVTRAELFRFVGCCEAPEVPKAFAVNVVPGRAPPLGDLLVANFCFSPLQRKVGPSVQRLQSGANCLPSARAALVAR